MLFTKTPDFLKYFAKSNWAMYFSPLTYLFLNSKQNNFRFFSSFYASNSQLNIFAFKNKNCWHLCGFYRECAFELIDWLILLAHQFWLVYLIQYQVVEIISTVFNYYHITTLKACSKMFHVCKTKFCINTVGGTFV